MDNKKFLNACIETIKLKGIVTPKKENFLKNWPVAVIWAVFAASLTFAFFLGRFLGRLEAENKNYKLETEYRSLKDSLRLLVPLPDTNPQYKPAQTTKNHSKNEQVR